MSPGTLHQGHELTQDVERSCDVCIIGSGAGGAVLAAGLAERGARVVMLEEGGYFTNADFDLDEASAYPKLYQERAARSTVDAAITVLQGRTVGGTTTVNWTTCYRTPERILEHWASVHGVEGWDAQTLAPHFEAVEQRLNIHEWPVPPNANNQALYRGCEALDWHPHILRRNVNGCVNSGYCGLGCPVNGKQGMNLTFLPDAQRAGMELFADTRAERLEVDGNRVVAVHARVLDRATGQPTGVRVTVRPKVCVSAGGAINAPALLQRSGLNANGRVGKRTFLHPVTLLPGLYDTDIDGWYGAPQSVACHQFVDRGDKMGFFLEVPPLQPMLAGVVFSGFGRTEVEFLSHLQQTSVFIALAIDGLLPGDDGGTVTWRDNGRIELDYPVRPWLAEAMRASHVAMARAHLAAGAKEVRSLHLDSVRVASEADLAALEAAPYGALEHPIATAHQMGGCSMGADPATSVVDSTLCHHQVRNLFCVDGSVLPTALGVNPSETIYGIAHRAREFVGAAL